MGIWAGLSDYLQTIELPPPGFSVCEFGAQTHYGMGRPAKEFWEGLGCDWYVSIDGNGKGLITVDLNESFSSAWQFDIVTDFGNNEHIFNQGQVWQTVHQLVKPGGLLIIEKPGVGYAENHGFYNYSETWVRDFALALGYAILDFSRPETPNGTLLRALMQKDEHKPWQWPQQAKYRSRLKVG